jgi:hypothetical protein
MPTEDEYLRSQPEAMQMAMIGGTGMRARRIGVTICPSKLSLAQHTRRSGSTAGSSDRGGWPYERQSAWIQRLGERTSSEPGRDSRTMTLAIFPIAQSFP